MVLNRTVFLVHCLCTISIASSTPFLQNLFLASSDDATHISDYRKQPRSDSRADKPQRFTLDTDFLINDDKESSPFQPTNPDNYAKILTKVIGNTKEKYETIINNLQDYQSNARLTNTDVTSNDSSRTKPISKKHFSRLVSTVMALNKLQQNKDPNFLSKYLTPSTTTVATPSAAFVRYPLLLELWENRATELERKINAKSMSFPSNNTTIKTINGKTFDNNYTNADQNSNRLNSADADTQKLLPVNVADVVPFQLLYRIPRTRAKFALQNAFYKYSNSMPNKTIRSQTNDDDSVGVVGATASAAVKDNGNEENSNAPTIQQASIITNNGIPLGNNDYLNEDPINSVENFTTSTINYDDDDATTNNNNNASFAHLNVRHINVQRQQKQQLHTNNVGDKENVNDIDNNIANNDGNTNVGDENVNINAETVGIFLLEIIGTVAGLTWGAFSQIQNSLFGTRMKVES